MKEDNTKKELYGTVQVSRMTGIGRHTVRKYLQQKKIPGHYNPMNRRWYTTKEGIRALKRAFGI